MMHLSICPADQVEKARLKQEAHLQEQQASLDRRKQLSEASLSGKKYAVCVTKEG